MSNTTSNKWKKALKITSKILLWIAGIWLSLLIILQIVLTPSVLTNLVNSFAADYIDGDLHFGKVSISMFSKFPRAELKFEDFTITYPADRYADVKDLGAQGHLMKQGCGETADTLVSFTNLSASINLASLITGEINIPHLNLEKPRIFIHRYGDGSANWEVFKLDDETEEEEEDTGMPAISFGEISLSKHPHIVYTDSKDTLFACISSKHIQLNGNLDIKNFKDRKVGLSIDSTFIAGRIVKDTLALGIDKLYMHEDKANRGVDIDAQMKMFAATNSFGRISVPIDIKGKICAPDMIEPTVEARDLRIKLAHIPINTNGQVVLKNDRASILANIEIPKCGISELKDKFLTNFIPELKKVTTDAELSMLILCDGDYIYETGSLPPVLAQFTLPQAHILHSDFPEETLEVELHLDAETDSQGNLKVKLTDLTAAAKGLDLFASGTVNDLLADDPSITFDTGVYANLDSLKRFIPEDFDLTAHGTLVALADGSSKLSQLDIYNFSESSLKGNILGENIIVDMPSDSLHANIQGLDVYLGPENRQSLRDASKSISMVGITGKAAKIDANYQDLFSLNTEGFSISAKNITSSPTIVNGKKTYPFSGRISADKLRFKDSDGTSLSMHKTRNSFRVTKKRDQYSTPLLSLTSRNDRIFAKTDANRVMVSDAEIKVRAEISTKQKKAQRKAFMDSLAVKYPDIPRDSLFKHNIAQKRKGITLPDWITEEDFKKEDIDIALDKTVAKYFRECDISGEIKVSRGRLMTPYFPLRNSLDTFNLKFNNDRIGIERFRILSGKSDIAATGELTGLKRALLGRKGALKLNVDLVSDSLDVSELFVAYAAGSELDSEDLNNSDNISDDAYMESILIDSTVVVETPLIVIPANLIADISMKAENVKYSDMKMDSLKSSIVMKERCVQLTNTHATTNVGEIDLEGFYSTRTKNDLKTGFSAVFKDITAEKVINLMPGLDTIVPLLKSFDGLLNCEVAATTQFDPEMNIITPSMNGIIRISGENLNITDNDYFSDIAKTLMFKNKKTGHVDRMMVEGIIKDSKLEIFPFILDIDRYRLGLSGVQGMDMSYRYHISLIKSPLLFKVGIDLYGNDFDDMRFKIGKAKYKNTDIPTFTTVIDKTKINLVESIHNIFTKGVEAAVKENSRQQEIVDMKEKIGYVQAVEQNIEELTEEEKQQIEKELNIKTFEKK